MFRRRPRREEEPRVPAGAEDGREEHWRELLEAALEELNEAFRRSGAAYACHLEEDEAGFLLKVVRQGGPPLSGISDEVDEALEPADLPVWLGRLRARLGLLVDEIA